VKNQRETSKFVFSVLKFAALAIPDSEHLLACIVRCTHTVRAASLTTLGRACGQRRRARPDAAQTDPVRGLCPCLVPQFWLSRHLFWRDAMEPVSHGIIFWLIIGGVAGALAGRIFHGGGFGSLMGI